jgi:hypothetical protein
LVAATLTGPVPPRNLGSYEKPNYHIFKYTPVLHIRQAACLFADVGWSQDRPFPQAAHDWAHNLGIAVDAGEIKNLTPEVSPAIYETKVSVDDLRAYAERIHLMVPFFAYLPPCGVPNPPAPSQYLRSPKADP